MKWPEVSTRTRGDRSSAGACRAGLQDPALQGRVRERPIHHAADAHHLLGTNSHQPRAAGIQFG